jgi:hypothetical protein
MKRFIGDFTPKAYDFATRNADEVWDWDFKVCVYPDGSAYGIADGKNCRKAPEGQVKETEAKLVQKLNDLYASTGKAPSAKQLEKAAATINSILETQGEERMAELADNVGVFLASSGGRKANTLSVDEVKALQDPEKQRKLMDAFDNDPQSLIGGKNKIIDFKTVDDQALDNVLAVVPIRLDGIGKPNNLAWAGTDKDGNAINEGNGGSQRGRELMRLWLSQQGKCAYTGMPLPLDYADLEHIRPLLSTGPAAENPKNWVFTLRSVNQVKGDKSMGDFLNTSVDSVRDYEAHQKKFDAAVERSVGKDQWRDRVKNAQFYSEFQNNRRSIIDSFETAKHLDYVAHAISKQKLSDDDDITFSREVNREGERNATKGLLNSKGSFTTGAVSGKVSLSKWITENYPDMSTADKSKVKRIYQQAKDELRANNNPYAQTSSGFGRRFAELINEEFAEK